MLEVSEISRVDAEPAGLYLAVGEGKPECMFTGGRDGIVIQLRPSDAKIIADWLLAQWQVMQR